MTPGNNKTRLSLIHTYDHVIESVDSLCRDGTDMPLASNVSELPNADVISLSDTLPALQVLLCITLEVLATVTLKNCKNAD